MNINIVRLNANKTNSEFVEKLNENLKNNHIYLKENVLNTPFTLFIVESGGVEGRFKEIMNNYNPPYYLVASNESNALAATSEIASYLNSLNVKHEIFYSDDLMAHDIITLACAYRAKERLMNLRLGVIGEPSDWLIASTVNYNAAKKKFGLDILDIDINELYRFIEKPYRIEYPDIYTTLGKKNPFDDRLLFESMLVYNGLKKIIKRHQLNGLTIRCFDLVKKYKISACLAISLLNDEGYIASCEGDVASLITMTIIRCLTSKQAFMANLSNVNLTNKECVFAHCTIPLSMCQNYVLDHHYETNDSLAIKGEMYLGNISIIKLSPDLSELRVLYGKIISPLSLSNYCKTQIKVRFDFDMDNFIDSKFANHNLIIYGKYEKLFKKFMSLYD